MPLFLKYKEIIIGIILLMIPVLSAAQCPSGDILLETQEQVDQFIIDYPNCTKINANLTIKERDVTDLSFLENITSINGDLSIHLTNAKVLALENLEFVGRDLVITNNEYVEKLDFPIINSIGRNLVINGNTNLLSISGFEKITSLNHLAISNNWYLKTIPEFGNLETLTEVTQIIENEHLEEIRGFNSLVCATGIMIHGNDILRTIDAFHSVVEILGSFGGLSITVNSALERIAGFEKLERVSYLILSQNAGANTPSNAIPTFPSLRSSGFVYLIDSNFPKNYTGFQNLIKVGGITIDGLRNIESFTAFNKIETAAFVNVANNRHLKKLSSFSSLQETQYEFIIKRNENLQEISDMKKLTKVGFDFGLFSLAITNFDFISNLKEVGTTYSRFDISDLPRLQDCSGLSNLIKYGYLLEPTDIDLQLNGCRTKEEIAASADTDRDGILDVNDPDDDNDGLSDLQENGGDEFLDTDGDFLPDHVDTDSDNDGCLDKDEGLAYFQQPGLAPVINTHPDFTEALSGDQIEFSVGVNNADLYNWQVSEDSGTTWKDIRDDNFYKNSDSPILEIQNLPVNFHNNLYRLKAGNSSGFCDKWVFSRFASLIVKSDKLGNPGEDTQISLCPSAGIIDLLGEINGNPDAGGQWSPPLKSGGSVFNTAEDAEGVYQYSFRNNNCQIAKANIEVSFKPVATAGADGELTICKSGAPVDLFTKLNGNPAPGGTWSPTINGENGMFDPKLDSAETYTYTVHTSACAPSSAKVEINLIQEDLNAGEDEAIEICKSMGPVELSQYLSGNAHPGGSWSPTLYREGFFDPEKDSSGDYKYTVSIDGCGTDEAVFSILVVDDPNPGLDSEIEICADTGKLNLLDFMEGKPDGNGVWSPALSSGTGIFDPDIDAPGTYTYTLENPSCGKKSADMKVSIRATPNPGEDAVLEICKNASEIDLFSLLGPNADATGSWHPGLSRNNIFDPQIDEAGVYEYRIETETCGSYSSFVKVNIIAPADTGESVSISLCADSPGVDLFELLGPTAEKGGVWHPSLISGSSKFDPGNDLPGTYTYTIDQGKCGSSSSTVNISLDGSEIIENYQIRTSEFEENNFIEIKILESGDFEYSLDGINFSSQNRFSNIPGGEHTLFVKEINACAYLSIKITLLDYDRFFTPNGDGFNDYWEITGFEGEDYKINIYDRYGKLLKVLNPGDNGWDGIYNGKPMPSNDYWFSLKLATGEILKGHFSLVRA